jgi:hypothetical protein
MSQNTYAFHELQMLCSQLLHDLISPFSAISTGVDLLCEQSIDDKDLIQMIHSSKNQLQERLLLFRIIFGYGNQDHEVINVFKDYLKEINVKHEIHVLPHCCPKFLITAGFWLTKQISYKQGLLEVHQSETALELTISQATLRDNKTEDEIVMGSRTVSSPRETYASYLRQMIESKKLQLEIQRSENKMTLLISPCLTQMQ